MMLMLFSRIILFCLFCFFFMVIFVGLGFVFGFGFIFVLLMKFIVFIRFILFLFINGECLVNFIKLVVWNKYIKFLIDFLLLIFCSLLIILDEVIFIVLKLNCFFI